MAQGDQGYGRGKKGLWKSRSIIFLVRDGARESCLEDVTKKAEPPKKSIVTS